MTGSYSPVTLRALFKGHSRFWMEMASVARFLRFVVFLLCVFSVGRAFAAGGTCPSGANYVNPINPTGPLVTLSSLGITSCYYVSAAGSDSLYDGTSEAVSGSHGPFLHSPGMANCSSNCASVTLSAGIGVIFRGGDTWHFGNSGATPYAGVVSSCADNGNNAAGLCLDDVNATSANPIYYGVDPGWYTGGSWARPVLTADNPLCGPGNTPSGCTYNPSNSCLPGAGSACTGEYYVASCAYQIGNSNNLVDYGFSEYLRLDNFELTGLCQNHLGQPSGFDDFVNYAADNDPVYFTNLYIHGWSHTQFGAPNGQTPCHGTPLSCVNIEAFHGNVTAAESGGVGESLFFNVVDGADSDPVGGWVGFAASYNTAYNVFRYNSGSAPGTIAYYHDNLWEYMCGNGHANLIESAERVTTAVFYNNVFRHAELSSCGDGGVILWPGPVASGTTDYIFNNLGYDIGPAEYLNMGGTGLTTNAGKYIWFNNTWQTGTSQTIFNCDVLSNTALDTNNHYIDDQNYIQTTGTCSTYVTVLSSLCQSNTSGGTSVDCPTYSDADTSPHYDQYTSSTVYGYSPAASTNSTVGAGTNETSGYCTTLLASSDALIQAAGTACLNPISYACGYVISTHSVNCIAPPKAAPVAAARGTAWNIGAYQLPPPAPNPPTNAAGTPVVQ